MDAVKYEDQICAFEDFCTTKDFTYLSVIDALNWYFSFNAILGLAHEPEDSKISLISQMYQNKKLPKPSFALKVSKRDAYLSLGKIGDNFARKGSKETFKL